ncbi:hypothetical protein EIP91_003364 [Steccherinum ochraceum]|uniref:BTB domain-containing protein n=1 Tax=Steccherinum ochraceum TaxID=92696 RepID=A0A4V2MW87_9APHY|nr:hypothetical protein EIP91_003364 [Steccherinum ochraceum]
MEMWRRAGSPYPQITRDCRLGTPNSSGTTYSFGHSTAATSQYPQAPVRHEKYYFDDEMVIFLVENRLFKVHKYFLVRESECFETMFQLPPGPSVATEGKSDGTPIILPDVTAEEFEHVLDFFYSGMYEVPKRKDTSRASLTRWTSLLSTAQRLAFYRLRDRAIAELWRLRGLLTPIERICLAQRFDLDAASGTGRGQQWVKPAYEMLSERREPLEVWEAEKVGMRVAVGIAKARERVLRAKFEGPSANQSREGEAQKVDVGVIVQSVFWPPPILIAGSEQSLD